MTPGGSGCWEQSQKCTQCSNYMQFKDALWPQRYIDSAESVSEVKEVVGPLRLPQQRVKNEDHMILKGSIDPQGRIDTSKCRSMGIGNPRISWHVGVIGLYGLHWTPFHAFINALQSMGIHWRAAPTEAPWAIGRNERHHGPIRDAFLRILAETPMLAADLALSMSYKARNDAPRAHGASPTTAVTGDPPRLIIGPNHHADPSISARARAMHAARNTMEKYAAADRLRGALSHPGTTVPFVEVGQEVWFHQHRHGWLRGAVHSLDGKTVYVRLNGQLFSSHESRTKPYISRTLLQLAGAKSSTYAPDGTCTRLSALRIAGYGTAVLP